MNSYNLLAVFKKIDSYRINTHRLREVDRWFCNILEVLHKPLATIKITEIFAGGYYTLYEKRWIQFRFNTKVEPSPPGKSPHSGSLLSYHWITSVSMLKQQTPCTWAILEVLIEDYRRFCSLVVYIIFI